MSGVWPKPEIGVWCDAMCARTKGRTPAPMVRDYPSSSSKTKTKELLIWNCKIEQSMHNLLWVYMADRSSTSPAHRLWDDPNPRPSISILFVRFFFHYSYTIFFPLSFSGFIVIFLISKRRFRRRKSDFICMWMWMWMGNVTLLLHQLTWYFFMCTLLLAVGSSHTTTTKRNNKTKTTKKEKTK